MPNLARPESRLALAEFVRHRRSRTLPEHVGLAAGARRRTPGLRREEVAQLAGVGLTWYTWFEQGRDIQVSADFLERLSRAFRLDNAERTHLYTLALNRSPPHAPLVGGEVSPAVRAMLATLPNPAYIKNTLWDLIAWNDACSALFSDLDLLNATERNALRFVFADPRYRRMIVDWEADARRILAKFRLDYGRAAGDPRFQGLVDELCGASAEFRRWWALQDVSGSSEGVKRLWHEAAGEIEFEHTAFIVEGAPELRLVVYTPMAAADAKSMRKVMAWYARQKSKASRR